MREGMQKAFDDAFEAYKREVVAGWNSYNQPLAASSRGSVQGRILPDGDGEVDIDLPAGPEGEAVLRAHENAGVIVRPLLDDLESVVEPDGRQSDAELTRVYSDFRIRAFILTSTDAREGWPEPRILPTPDDQMDRRARRRVWL